jgi:hypothetical protein
LAPNLPEEYKGQKDLTNYLKRGNQIILFTEFCKA